MTLEAAGAVITRPSPTRTGYNGRVVIAQRGNGLVCQTNDHKIDIL